MENYLGAQKRRITGQCAFKGTEESPVKREECLEIFSEDPVVALEFTANVCISNSRRSNLRTLYYAWRTRFELQRTAKKLNLRISYACC